jgi:hypothetical protein
VHKVVRVIFSVLLLPVRIFGYGADIYTLWSKKEWAVTVGVPLFLSGLSAAFVFAQQYPWPIVLAVAAGMLLIIFWAVAVIIEAIRNHRPKQGTTQLAQESEEQPLPSTGILIEESEDIRTSRNLTRGFERGMHARGVKGLESEDDVHLRDEESTPDGSESEEEQDSDKRDDPH